MLKLNKYAHITQKNIKDDNGCMNKQERCNRKNLEINPVDMMCILYS